MKKLKNSVKLILLFLFIFLTSPAMVHALTIDSIGGDDSIIGLGSTVKTYSTLLTTFTVAGTASAGADVVLAMDDLTQTTVSNSLGNWLLNFSDISYGDHNLIASSAGESLDLVLTVGVATASTNTSTSSSTTALPESGGLEDTVLLFAFGMLVLGLGTMLKFKN